MKGPPRRRSSDSTPTTDAADGKVLVAALGDSITAGSPLWDPDPAVRDQIGPDLDEHSQFEYWASKADPALDFRNCGVFGERTDEIAQRLQECADGADALIIQGGINDIAQGLPPSSRAAGSLRGMVDGRQGPRHPGRSRRRPAVEQRPSGGRRRRSSS